MARGRDASDLHRWAGAVVLLLLSVRQGAGQEECTLLASKLYACFPYVQVGNITRVAGDCCVPLKSIVDTRPDCVCFLQGLLTEIPKVNVTHAYELSTLCNITSSATLSSCNGSHAPAPAPASASATIDRNGAFSLHRASTFYRTLIGSALLVYIFD